jgi:Big-like domain-containing protein
VKRTVWYILLAILVIIATRCANSISPPQGGPKDITPPKVLETMPPNGSPGFTSDRFSINFNEFISLENVMQSALISPPMKEAPDFRIKGKTLQVVFNEELRPNTTYSVYFGDAIVDITEKNPLSNYTYIFSTGDYVDSLSMYGTVLNAFDLKPVEDSYVMLYKDNNDTISFDSLPFFVAPYYLSKTDENGNFRFSGLSYDRYLLFSINDQNSNYIFDQPSEQIAFIDTLISPSFIELPKTDTLSTDTISGITNKSDSISVIIDSTEIKRYQHMVENNSFQLFMFLSPDTNQRLLKAEVVSKNKLQFSFSQPADNVKYEMQRYYLPDSMFVKEYSTTEDTVTWFLNNPPLDSLELLITQYNDTLGTSFLKLNTEKKNNRSKKKDQPEKKEYLTWKSNLVSSTLSIDKHIQIEFNQPFVSFNKIDSTLLVIDEDSIWNPAFTFADSLNMKIKFPFDLKEDTRYRIYFPDSAFTNWNLLNSEEIDIKFNTLPLKDYGTLTFNLLPETEQYFIFQLMNDKEVVLKEIPFTNDTSITFNYVVPANYIFKVIMDRNNNGQWDPGNYGLNLQPEEVIYYPKELKVRAYWEIEEKWEF